MYKPANNTVGPDRIPYGMLPPAKRDWLVLNGYPDQGLAVKAPSVWGVLG